MKNKFFTLISGIFFGIVLIKGQVASWFQINEMFHFRSPYMYLVITSAIVVAAISVFIIRRFEVRTVEGAPIEIKKKPFTKGIVIGGTIFGMGWAITGACPGPIYAQFGSGALLAGISFLGALTGMYLYAFLQPRLPHTGWGRFGPQASGTGSSS